MHEIFQRTTVIPVVTVPRAADAVPLGKALLRAGLRLVEVTLRTPESLAVITTIARELPDMEVGAGTVLTPADVTRAAEAGARFLVSPGLTQDLVAAGLASELPYIPGAVTPSEIIAAREHGFSLLKFFPAIAFGGTEALRQLAPVFPGIAFCPTGGLNDGNAEDFLALPNVPMVGGAWMAPADAIAAGDWAGIEEKARRAARLGRG